MRVGLMMWFQHRRGRVNVVFCDVIVMKFGLKVMAEVRFSDG
ncbi:hypothetical protein HMPREF9621_01001 [Cutibacterium modestum HL037PA2]|uniref:Uncharacterized protein n=1 Tax=Cutibacterium modestum HL044PA1 TaxID=765109 RepID=A0ABP2K8H0_9ACTN|nr:hypothetical protein HMPREF9621_01001 [Cutibacterium modestum HL037PA2]EFS93231.1 hypothetical protein HMPREF9607_00443 [Cutibacterium modestum HL044PA1]